jgi:hypothetical protein
LNTECVNALIPPLWENATRRVRYLLHAQRML